MKKRLLIAVFALLIVIAVSAQGIESDYNASTIPRYTDFPLDNVHILRLQEASKSLGGNVSELKEEMLQFQEKRSEEIAKLENQVSELKTTLNSQVREIKIGVDELSDKQPEIEMPASANTKTPDYVIFLAIINIVLVALIIILFVMLKKKQELHSRHESLERHIHPAPPELTAYVKRQLDNSKKLHDIRIELASKGWTPSIIEHAVHAAREWKNT